VKPVDELDALSVEMTALLAEPEMSLGKYADLMARFLAMQMRHRRRLAVEWTATVAANIAICVMCTLFAATSSGGSRLLYLVLVLIEAAILTRTIFNGVKFWQSMNASISVSRVLLATLLSALPDEVKPPN